MFEIHVVLPFDRHGLLGRETDRPQAPDAAQRAGRERRLCQGHGLRPPQASGRHRGRVHRGRRRDAHQVVGSRVHPREYVLAQERRLGVR